MTSYQDAEAVVETRGPRRRIPVDIVISDGECSIAGARYKLSMKEGSLRDHNRDFVDEMGEVRKAVNRTRSLKLDPVFYQKVMRNLREMGLSAYVALGDQVRKCLSGYEERANGVGLEITVQTESHSLLWEFMYTGSHTGPVDPSLFWGYRHSIGRFLPDARFLPIEIDPWGGFLFCWNDSLKHWEAEMRALNRLVDERYFVNLDDCLNKLGSECDQLEPYNQVLWVFTRSHPFSFVHIASHLVDPRTSKLRAFLKITCRNGNVEISIRQLNAARAAWHFRENPLVFLNACQTMTSPEQLGQEESFPGSFLGLGAGAVIATACDVPDLFAVEFAHKFYEIFLDRDHCPTAGDALRQTRKFFIDHYNNPLGLAYGLYGHNDLTIYW